MPSSELEEASGGGDNSHRYFQLYKAALSGDWETAKKIFEEDKDAATAPINKVKEPTLSVAVLSRNANDFVRKMVDMLPPEALVIQDCAGDTALHNAAQVGNTEVAKILVTKNPDLLYILSNRGRLAITKAAKHGHKDTVEYLMLSMSKPHVERNPAFQGQSGFDLLITLIYSRYLDFALDLIVKYPDLARLERDGHSALSAIAARGKNFLSGERFGWLDKWFYHSDVPLKHNKFIATNRLTSSAGRDVEDGSSEAPMSDKSFHIFCGVSEKLKVMLWKIVQRLVPYVEEIMEKKAVHQEALALVKRVCQEMLALPQKEASSMFESSITKAAASGISEIVEVIMDVWPMAIYARDSDSKSTIFHLAARYRFEKVFNLLYSLGDRKYQFYDVRDKKGNNLMHICARLAPSNRLNLVPGAALQMQRELQWYNEMEKLVQPSHHMSPNKNKEIPDMLFTKEHDKLKVDGEKWMKDTANACSISAALIATVVFAAVFTVPGGVENGKPVSIGVGLYLFVISDVVSLFTSITSLLMFVSILTSRYAEQDFLYALPKRLIIGLLSLFISITFMMIAFSVAISFVINMKCIWYLIPIASLACLPVTSFVLLQFPLLVELVYSTYGPSIFGNKSD